MNIQDKTMGCDSECPTGPREVIVFTQVHFFPFIHLILKLFLYWFILQHKLSKF